MNSAPRVATPPLKPVMIYDGDCRFCMVWIRRWQRITGDHLEYLAFQDPQVAARFPEVPRGQFQSAVHLIEPDGAVYRAAEAVFRSLAVDSRRRWLLNLYQRFPTFSAVTEWGYQFVARHRTFFSALTRMFWGRHAGPFSYLQIRWIFLRSLGIIYLLAFVSLGTQIVGLIGRNGILPLEPRMQQAHEQVAKLNIGLDRYRILPTLGWFDASDRFLRFQCVAGAVLAVLLILGIAPAPCLMLLWLIYLSLMTAGDVFLGYQWDALLLHTGFLAIFLAPLQLLPRRPSRETPPSRIVVWLLRWLLFCLMFQSGCVKRLSGDPVWRDLTALNVHYETQPLPTWIGWYAHQLPEWIQKACTATMFGIELGIPFLIFLPRRPRQFACFAFLFLQLIIFLTGNYCFFNLLTMALCFTLLDDDALQRFLPGRWRTSPVPKPGAPAPKWFSRLRWPLAVTLPLLAIVLCTSLVQFLRIFRFQPPGSGPVIAIDQWLAPFRTFNSYGLFAAMTTTRPEIVIEGSNDGVTWKAYEFNYKPGDLKQRPGFVAPHQPRLDWQMWFAALGIYRHNPWLVNFCVRLLQDSPEVLALLKHNPFPDAPPRAIRAQLYEYHFTDLATRRRSGEWWRRELKGEYLPALSLRDLTQ